MHLSAGLGKGLILTSKRCSVQSGWNPLRAQQAQRTALLQRTSTQQVYAPTRAGSSHVPQAACSRQGSLAPPLFESVTLCALYLPERPLGSMLCNRTVFWVSVNRLDVASQNLAFQGFWSQEQIAAVA